MYLHNRLFAEFFGTLWLVLGGVGSAKLAAAFPDGGIGLDTDRFCDGDSIGCIARDS